MNVLFICTGNIFRSMSAEYLLRSYLSNMGVKGINVSSAGTTATSSESPHYAVLEELLKHGVDAKSHVKRHVTQEIINCSDLITAMADYHIPYIKAEYGLEIPLYNEIALGLKTTVPDVNECGIDWRNDFDGRARHERKIVNYLHDSMPDFYKNMGRFIIHHRELLSPNTEEMLQR
jgi:protein-tyrosine phosphatase